MDTEKVTVREGRRARPQTPVPVAVPVVRTVSSQQPGDYIVAEGEEALQSCTVSVFVTPGPNTHQLSAGQGESGESLVAQIEKIKTFLAAANNIVEKTDNNRIEGEVGGDAGDGVYWADVVLIDQNDNEENLHLQSSRTPVRSRTEQTNKRKSWMQENLNFVQLNDGESEV